ncbi:hypothetical protein As57867_025484, partial [Aphanomyces stellatus]
AALGVSVLCAGKTQKKAKTTMEDVLWMVGLLQVVVIGPMVLIFVFNLVRDPAFKDVLKGLWSSVRSRTLSDLSGNAPVQHATAAARKTPKDSRYTN